MNSERRNAMTLTEKQIVQVEELIQGFRRSVERAIESAMETLQENFSEHLKEEPDERLPDSARVQGEVQEEVVDKIIEGVERRLYEYKPVFGDGGWRGVGEDAVEWVDNQSIIEEVSAADREGITREELRARRARK